MKKQGITYSDRRLLVELGGPWPDVPREHRALSFGALKSPTDWLVRERDAREQLTSIFGSPEWAERAMQRDEELRRP